MNNNYIISLIQLHLGLSLGYSSYSIFILELVENFIKKNIHDIFFYIGKTRKTNP